MRELRIQTGDTPLRIFYAFDPRRTAILLIGGDKTGVSDLYERFIPIADNLYQEHTNSLAAEAQIEQSASSSAMTNERKKKRKRLTDGR